LLLGLLLLGLRRDEEWSGDVEKGDAETFTAAAAVATRAVISGGGARTRPRPRCDAEPSDNPKYDPRLSEVVPSFVLFSRRLILENGTDAEACSS
jgi:hypothetical protein